MKHQPKFWSHLMKVLFVVWAVFIVPVPFVMESAGWGDRTALLLPIYAIIFIATALAFRPYVTERHRNVLLAAKPAKEVLAQDRPFIVYLRSFNDEQQILKRYRRAFPTEEEQIAAAFDSYGTIIAIDNPDAKLPALGAAHLSASLTTWEDKVKSLVDNATFVILRLGCSPGVLRELRIVIRRIPPSHVILLTALTADAHANAAAMVQKEFGIRLPRHTRRLSAIIFDKDWNSALRLLRAWNLRGSPRTTYLQVSLQAALVPFLRHLGFKAELPSVQAYKIAAIIFSLLVVAIMCYGFFYFPYVLVFRAPSDQVTMSIGFLVSMAFLSVFGVSMAVLFVGILLKSIEEIWFPDHFVNPWWARLRERSKKA